MYINITIRINQITVTPTNRTLKDQSISGSADCNWLQLKYSNPLLYSVDVRNFPSLDRGVFCILIVYLISKIALALFILLLSSNYHYKKVPLKVDFVKCKTIHSELLPIVVLQSKLLHLVIGYFLFLFL